MDGSIPQRGVIVPQPVYRAPAQFSPLHPIKFAENRQHGMNLGNALKKNFAGLANKDVRPVISETAKKVTIRVNVRTFTPQSAANDYSPAFAQWPGYEAWSTVVHIVDHSFEGRPTNMAKLAHDIAKVINELKKVCPWRPGFGLSDRYDSQDMSAVQPRDPNWSLDKLSLDSLLLLELRHVSAGSWQPVLSLDL